MNFTYADANHSHALFFINARAGAFKSTLHSLEPLTSPLESIPILPPPLCYARSDAMASLVAVCGIAGSALGYSLLDPLAGLVVCFMLLGSGVDIASSGLRPLV